MSFKNSFKLFHNVLFLEQLPNKWVILSFFWFQKEQSLVLSDTKLIKRYLALYIGKCLSSINCYNTRKDIEIFPRQRVFLPGRNRIYQRYGKRICFEVFNWVNFGYFLLDCYLSIGITSINWNHLRYNFFWFVFMHKVYLEF